MTTFAWFLLLTISLGIIFVVFGITSFCLLRRIHGSRRAHIIVYNVVFFVLLGTGIILEILGSELCLFIIPISYCFSLAAFLLAVIKPSDEEKEKEIKKTSNISYIEELEALKKLLDNGVITQEEFDNKKRSILEKQD